jgi:hypothetical protein
MGNCEMCRIWEQEFLDKKNSQKTGLNICHIQAQIHNPRDYKP